MINYIYGFNAFLGLFLLIYFFSDRITKKNKLNNKFDFISRLKDSLLEQNLNQVTIDIKEKQKYQYDSEKNVIYIQNKDSIYDVFASFHELGHAIDFKKYEGKKYYWYHTVLFYTMKYSVILSGFLLFYKLTQFKDMLILPLVFTLLANIFFIITLKEEIVASKYGLKELRKYVKLTKKENRLVKLALYNGLSSYILLLFISILFFLLNFRI